MQHPSGHNVLQLYQMQDMQHLAVGMFRRVEGGVDLAGIVHELLQLLLAIILLRDQAGPSWGLGAARSHACTCPKAKLVCKR